MSHFNPYRAKVGDRLTVTLKDGNTYDMTVWRINEPMSGGIAEHRISERILAHIRPGGFGLNLASPQIANVRIAT